MFWVGTSRVGSVEWRQTNNFLSLVLEKSLFAPLSPHLDWYKEIKFKAALFEYLFNTANRKAIKFFLKSQSYFTLNMRAWN